MNGSEAYIHDQMLQSLRKEYEVVGAGLRLFNTIRFGVVAFAATIQSALLGAYQFTLSHPRSLTDPNIDLWSGALAAVPLFGALTIYVVMTMEGRVRKLIETSVLRGIEIEDELGLGEGGYFHKLWDAPFPHQFAQVIELTYVTVFVVWVLLLLRSI